MATRQRGNKRGAVGVSMDTAKLRDYIDLGQDHPLNNQHKILNPKKRSNFDKVQSSLLLSPASKLKKIEKRRKEMDFAKA
jgi:hypothetical protein